MPPSPPKLQSKLEQILGYDVYRKAFPRLVANGFKPADVTSPIDGRYNCIAFAAQDYSNWWWPYDPTNQTIEFWPPTAPNVFPENTGAFIATFVDLGYELCPTPEVEQGFEKVAIFVDPANHDRPLHMARDDGDGVWKSKCGSGYDIRHYLAEALEGGQGSADYGVALYFMKRSIEIP